MGEMINERSLEGIHWNGPDKKVDGSVVMVSLELYGLDPILALSRVLYETAFNLDDNKVTEEILPLVVALEHEAQSLKATLDRLENEWRK